MGRRNQREAGGNRCKARKKKSTPKRLKAQARGKSHQREGKYARECNSRRER